MLSATRDLKSRLAGIRLILMDIDGTLTTSDRATFENVSEQLRRLKRHGVPFSVATGRSISGAMPVVERLRLVGTRMAPMINYNGAVLLSAHDGTLIDRHTISPDGFRAALSLCLEAGLWPIVYTCRENIGGPLSENVYLSDGAPPSAEFNGMRVERVSDLLSNSEDVVAVLADAGDVEASARLAKALSSRVGATLRITSSGSRYVEICAPQATKLHAMQRVADWAGAELGQVMAIGDNVNDLDMIKAAGVGVAVNNAPAEVKAAAAYTCTHVSADGVVEALRMLVRVLDLGGKTSAESATWRNNRLSRAFNSPLIRG